MTNSDPQTRGGVQYAAARYAAEYPPSWGRPQGDRHSVERTAWVAENVRRMNPTNETRAHLALWVARGKVMEFVADYGPGGRCA